MTKHSGFTIIQLMVVLLIAGLAGSFLINAIIEKRCESDPSSTLCTKNAKPSAS
ncbi:type II secretion system protein [Noviherbaspirillum sp.]|uniref:type II secretion system protein n=1 Tax=Noviherbaspirillum sp. TaxID=1926288 RepID=UPI002FE3BA7B